VVLGIIAWVGVVWDVVEFGENGRVARKLWFICMSGSYNDGMEAQDIMVVVFSQPRESMCVSFTA
jgi:hypothetical protein